MSDEDAFLREILNKPFWNLLYHEKKLVPAQVKLAFAKDLVKRCDINPDAERADTDKDGEPIPKNVTEFALEILDECERSVEYHENSLREAHKEIAFVKALLMRGNYPFTVADLQKAAEEHD